MSLMNIPELLLRSIMPKERLITVRILKRVEDEVPDWVLVEFEGLKVRALLPGTIFDGHSTDVVGKCKKREVNTGYLVFTNHLFDSLKKKGGRAEEAYRWYSQNYSKLVYSAYYNPHPRYFSFSPEHVEIIAETKRGKS